MSCGENGYEVGRERQSRLAGTDAERDWDWMWCDGITHHLSKTQPYMVTPASKALTWQWQLLIQNKNA